MDVREFIYSERDDLAEMLAVQKKPFLIRTEGEEKSLELQRLLERMKYVKSTVITEQGVRVIPEENVCRT